MMGYAGVELEELSTLFAPGGCQRLGAVAFSGAPTSANY
jgi:hypothetical protein